MPQHPEVNKFLEAGAHFSAVTRAEAQRRAKELIREGQLAQGRAQAFVEELVDSSRRRAEELTEVMRREVQRQVGALGIATNADLARLEAKLSGGAAPKKGAGARKAATRKPAKKAAKKKKAPAKKAATRR
jgi:polyhydroxyalkanoate synthesis regulator phasin